MEHRKRKTISVKQMRQMWRRPARCEHEERPVTLADCAGKPGPCPWVGCKHHLYLDVRDNGSIVFNHLGDVLGMKDTCSLMVAARHGTTLEEVGEVMNLTRERVRQIEAIALRKLARVMRGGSKWQQ